MLGMCLMALPHTIFAKEKPNVLFICVDDFRPELSCLGSIAKTPNMDRLAAKGTAFYNHYAVIPTSGASRCCIFTGQLPTTRADLDNNASEVRLSNADEGKRPETMFHHMRRNGYYTVGIGKVSHSADGRVYKYTEPTSKKLEFPYSWDEMLFNADQWETGWNSFFAFDNGESRTSMKGQVKPYQCTNDQTRLPDELTADIAVDKLKELAKKDQPFCMAVGFFKPHLPFVSPKRFWDLYNEKEIPISPVPEIPVNGLRATLMPSGEFKSYKLGNEAPSLDYRVSDEYARKLRHAYLSCVSFTDAQVGRVLDTLKELKLDDNTIVVLWGDHGWQLGDYRVWGKHTLHDIALNSALIVKAPGYKKNVKSRRIVSSIDIYPTLMDLCGIEKPECLDGESFVSLLRKPKTKEWTDRALGFFETKASVRTPEYRLIYDDYKKKEPVVELYKYDKDNFERINVANEHPEKVKELKAQLDERYDIIKSNLKSRKR